MNLLNNGLTLKMNFQPELISIRVHLQTSGTRYLRRIEIIFHKYNSE